eukprot:TRINITY_DN2434_c0_g1_i1.p2 TRINITY_DN2434_c0_g1~~TRINITY_DN2434_c0_g1_i1.p2  ORF type:complete len:167 (+),score=93.82 TRINITY_DN2434_c0_g1_i1:74-574(+)
MAPPAPEVDDELANTPDIFYVSKKVFEECQAKLKGSKDIGAEEVKKLASAEDLDDSEVMIPIDMRGAGDELEDDVEEMVTKLGPKKSVEIFVKCREYFVANKDKEPEEDRPQNITVGEWKQLMEDDFEGEEEDLFEDEEEEDCEEEALEDEAEEDAEPAAKKAKTS